MIFILWKKYVEHSSNNLMEDNSFSEYQANMSVVFKSRETVLIEFLQFIDATAKYEM